MNVTASKIGSTCCSASHSTATSPQLAVPLGYRPLLVLQFLLLSTISDFPDVETSESFPRLWLALGSQYFWHERLF